ncbi:MAG: type II 3-dehydroquinate dehydratase [Lachnospiraceae bacterium]|nr:type II 3-dehydroquinate dehydratase [Lachnospiraceae bacterium]MCR5087010.1 type II 3-dehydroquinate dehydratase [Lachnospiraceae bacterium]
MAVKTLLIINGPNLSMLGMREPEIYGKETLDDLQNYCRAEAKKLGYLAETFQSNSEGEIVTRLNRAMRGNYSGIIINPAAFTHYSYAIYDALLMLSIPKVEVHLSNIYNREQFRSHSVTAGACDRQIYGRGFAGYSDAMEYIDHLLKEREKGK